MEVNSERIAYNLYSYEEGMNELTQTTIEQQSLSQILMQHHLKVIFARSISETFSETLLLNSQLNTYSKKPDLYQEKSPYLIQHSN